MCRVNNLTTFICWFSQNLGSSVFWYTLGLFRFCFTVSCIWTTSRYLDCLHVIKGPYVNTEQICIQQRGFTNKLIAIRYPGECQPPYLNSFMTFNYVTYHVTYTLISVSCTFSSHYCTYNQNIPKLFQGFGMYRQLYYYIYFI